MYKKKKKNDLFPKNWPLETFWARLVTDPVVRPVYTVSFETDVPRCWESFLFSLRRRDENSTCARARRASPAGNSLRRASCARGGTARRPSPPATSRFLRRPSLLHPPPPRPPPFPLGARPSAAIKPFAARQAVSVRHRVASRPSVRPSGRVCTPVATTRVLRARPAPSRPPTAG